MGGLLLMALVTYYFCFLNYGPGGTLSGGDSAKFATLMLQGGVPHTPFYPLYLLLLRLWRHATFLFDPAAQGALLSAFLVAGGLVFLWDFLRRQSNEWLFSFIAVFICGTAPFFVTAGSEINPVALSIFLFFLALNLSFSSAPLFAAGSIWGLLFFHDPLALWFGALFLPLLFILAVRQKGYKEALLALLALFVVGLLPYLFTIFSAARPGPKEYLISEKLFATLGKGILNGQFWANYFVYPLSELKERTINQAALLGNLCGLSVALSFPILLLGFCFRKKNGFFFFGTVLFLAAALASFLFCVPNFHFYNAQWAWLFQCVIALFLAISLHNIATFKAGRIFLWPLFFLVLLAFPIGFSKNYPKNRQNLHAAAELAHLYGSLPVKSALLCEDLYLVSEVYSYYKVYMPLMTPDDVLITSSLIPERPNFFWTEAILNVVKEQKIPYQIYLQVGETPIYSLGTVSHENKGK